MKIKEGVNLLGLTSQLVLAAVIADSIWRDHEQELVITCGSDSNHTNNSKHFSGNAIDLRTRYFDAATALVVYKELSTALGDEYDVVHHQSHIHVEWDPKTGVNL